MPEAENELKSESVAGRKFEFIDLSKIEEASLGDKAFIKTMISTLKAEVPPIIANSKTAFANKNYEQFAREIHKLKNCLLMLGMDKLHKDLTLLEEKARQNEVPEELEKIFGKILYSWDKAEVELQTV